MRNTLLAAAFLAATIATGAQSSGARAMEIHQPAQQVQSLYTCSGGGASRVAFTPSPCCTGQIGCPQLLSNTGLTKPKRDNRT